MKKLDICFLIAFLPLALSLIAQQSWNKYHPQVLENILGLPNAGLLNIGNMSSWQYNNGRSGIAPDGYAGIIYPRATANVVFQDGFIWGGFTQDPNSPQLRAGGQTYRVGTQGGRIISIGNAEDPNAPHVRIYKIRPDYLTLTYSQLRREAAEFFMIPLAQVTLAMTDSLISQYTLDWNEWPVQSGAPFYDLNGNGIYEPQLGEQPGLANADQVLWFVCNDLDSALTHDFYGSPPMGMELQVTMWAYYQPGSDIGQVTFRRYRLINKSGYQIDSMYIAQWSDTDVGSFNDDLVGCDSLLNLGFCYNGIGQDLFFIYFDLAPSAIGYGFLYGPIVPGQAGQDLNHNGIDDSMDFAMFNFRTIGPGFINLPMTSFAYFIEGSPFGEEPPFGQYESTKKWYNVLRGFSPISGDLQNPIPYLHGSGPFTGRPTKFPLNGDPVTGQGDIDYIHQPPAPVNRRMSICSGPFTMMPGDTQEAIVAVVGGNSGSMTTGNAIASLALMKSNYESIPPEPPLPKPPVSYQISYPNSMNTLLEIRVDLREFIGVKRCGINFLPEYGNQQGFNMFLFDDGMHNDSLASDGIWGNSKIISNRKHPFKADLTAYTISERLEFKYILSRMMLRPIPELINWRVTWENGQQDSSINYGETVHLAFDMHNVDGLNKIDGMTIYNLGSGGGSQVVSYQDSIQPGETVTDNSFYLQILGPSQGDSVAFFYAISFDEHGRTSNSSYPVVPWNPNQIWGDTLEVQSVKGALGNVLPIVADPLLITGHLYRMTYYLSSDSVTILWRLHDLNTGSLLLDDQYIASDPFFPHPVVDGIQFQVTSPDPGFVDFQTVANGAGVLDPPEGAAADWQGFPGIGPPTGNQQLGAGKWLTHTGGPNRFLYSTFLGRVLRNDNADRCIPFDYEMRFTAAGGLGWWYYTTGNLAPVPFELWNIGINTPDDPSDDYRMIPLMLDEWVMNDVYDLGANPNGTGLDHDVSDGDDDPYLDWVYWYNPANTSPGTAGYDDFVANGGAAVGEEVMARTVLVNWDGGDVNDPTFPANVNQLMPEEGTIFRILTTKPNFPGDTLEVMAPPPLGIIDSKVPLTFYLEQNYPNPFNPETKIQFGIAEPEKVKLAIYNVLGQQIKTLINRNMLPGKYDVVWDGRNEAGNKVGTGIYFYRLQAGKFVKSRKMVLLK
jgi:hypothetical protein